MSELPSLANQLYLSGHWAVTLSQLEREGAQLDAVVVSRKAPEGRDLHRVSFYPAGEIQVPRRAPGLQIYVRGDENNEWGRLFIPSAAPDSIEPSLIYQYLTKNAARNLLSGHLLTVMYHPLMRMREETPHIDVASRWEREFKFTLADGEKSLTAFTAYAYKSLTNWLESSPAQLIALMEQVSVSTIRNRLNAARESGLIPKPGSGVRGIKRSSEK